MLFLKIYYNNLNMKYSFTIGRFQPLHKGHKKFIRKVLEEGKNVCVLLRDTPISESNPYSVEEREKMFEKSFPKEISEGRLKVVAIPGVDIEEVFWGRKVGWSKREIRVDEETEAISATEIREKMEKETTEEK